MQENPPVNSRVIHQRKNVTNQLKQWANSFSGCDGGTPESDIWLCGIEWGYEAATDEERYEYYKNGLPKEINSGEQKLDTTYDFFTDESMEFPFNLAFAKIFSALKNTEISDITDKILKLNLSPIAFRKDDDSLWGENLSKATGFDTKAKFIEYLNGLNRFEEITRTYSPKLIVCIGNGYRANFKNSFFGNNEIQFKGELIKPEDSNKNQNNRYMYHTKINDTLMVVTPFSTSQNGLNSDYLLKKVGEKIKDLL